VAYVDWPTPGVEGRRTLNLGTHPTSPDWLALAKLSVIRQLSMEESQPHVGEISRQERSAVILLSVP